MKKYTCSIKKSGNPIITSKGKNIPGIFLTVLLLVSFIFSGILGCSSAAQENVISSQASEASLSSSERAAEEESTVSSSISKPAPDKVMSEGKFQVTCLEFVPFYEKKLQESSSDNANLVMRRVDGESSGEKAITFQMYKGEIDTGIIMSFTSGGKAGTENKVIDSVSLVCSLNSLNKQIWPAAFAVLNQTIQPDLSYIECLKQMQQGMDEVTTDDPSFTYTIDEVTYTFQLYTNELFSFTAATNSENLPNKTDESKVESPSLSSDSGKTGDDPTLVTNPVKFISEYKTKLKVLGVLYDKYSISVTEDTSNGNRVLTHMLNGKSTGVKLTFASDGVLLTGGLANKEEDVQTASFCMAAIMKMITPSKGSFADCVAETEEMLDELMETGDVRKNSVYRNIGRVKYGMTFPGSMVFSVSLT